MSEKPGPENAHAIGVPIYGHAVAERTLSAPGGREVS